MKEKVIDLGQITDTTISIWSTMYEKRGEYYYCRRCGSQVMQTTCYVSIHLAIFEPSHTGPGKVVHINHPYCPRCDGEIEYATACYHVGVGGALPLLINEGRP